MGFLTTSRKKIPRYELAIAILVLRMKRIRMHDVQTK